MSRTELDGQSHETDAPTDRSVRYGIRAQEVFDHPGVVQPETLGSQPEALDTLDIKEIRRYFAANTTICGIVTGILAVAGNENWQRIAVITAVSGVAYLGSLRIKE